MQIQHNLHKSPLFTDAAIEQLIEAYPREHYDFTTPMWRQGCAPSFNNGGIGF